MNTARYTISYRNGMPMKKELTAKKHVSPRQSIVITKIGLRLTFHHLNVFLSLERAITATIIIAIRTLKLAITATIIIAIRTLKLVEDDTNNQTIARVGK